MTNQTFYDPIDYVQSRMADIIGNWDEDSEDYSVCATAIDYLEHYRRFLTYLKETDQASVFGDFMISYFARQSRYS